MKTNYVVCPLSGHSLCKGSRLRRLSNVEEMLASTYGHFFRQVEQPYSCVEQEILTRIIKSLSSLLQGDLPRPCFFCKFAKCDLVFWGRVEFFRLELPAENPFSVSSRLYCLRELENKLNCYFVNEGRNKPYSWREMQVIRRIKKRFVHELRNTSKYNLFKGTHVRRVSEEEQLELKNQKTDEIRLNHVSICHYNPLSEKFKNKKEEYLKEIEEKFGKS
ncbi:hypothetical protein [Bacteroides acidifaciens]|uniref:hypothetical protein n=1 Tax=Bacteroides acidifaciens TaxID=85831 RepID=UPI0025770D75|nr:hypothetical protein [Bacteroides acidifaciens]